MLELVQLGAQGERRPAQLSGGQRQRVALARALINHPKVLLLDEPLGALDLKLREEMQIELKSLQKKLGITFVYVTHDQGEALSMADRVAVFNRGRIEQLAAPRELYTAARRPPSSRASSAAPMSPTPRWRQSSPDAATAVRDARREHRGAWRDRAGAAGRHVCAPGAVVAVQFHGAASRWQVQLDAGEVWSALVTDEDTRVLNGLGVGARVKLSLAARGGGAADRPASSA